MNDKELDRFISTFTAKDHLQKSVLPATANLDVEFFRAENYDDLIKYFTQCAKHSKGLRIDFPIDGGSMPVSFPHIILPNLRSIDFVFSDKTLPIRGEYDRNEVFGENRNSLAFLQSILNASPKLNHFKVSVFDGPLPANFEYLNLPASIRSVYLEYEFKTSHANFMLRNTLPNLEDIF